jgi:hypothetical protein
MRTAYDPTAANQRWDQTGAAIQGASQAGSDRLAGIMQELASKAAEARTGVSQAVERGGTALQGLQNQFQGQAQQLSQGLGSGLGAFGVQGGVQNDVAQSLNNLFAAGQVQNTQMGAGYDAMASDRPAIFAGLNADVAQGMTRDEVALQNSIAAKRAQELQNNSSALAQALGQTAVQRAQDQRSRQEAADRLRLEMAQLGITV